MAASEYLNQVKQLDIAHFGNHADPFGQHYGAQAIGSFLVAFSASLTLYGTLSTTLTTAAINSNVFYRAPVGGDLASQRATRQRLMRDARRGGGRG
jgi:hypothetical protein